MNTSQPQDSLEKKLKKLKKGKKLKKNEAKMGTRLLTQPPTRHWEAKHSATSIQKLLHGPCAYNDDVEIDTADTLENTRLGLAPTKRPCHSSTERSPEIFCCPKCFR